MTISTVINNKSTMFNEYLNDTIYNLLDKTFVIPETFEYNVLVVDGQYIMRPDLISLDAYGDTMYADVICKLNGVNPFEVNQGMELILPSPEYITQFSVQPETDDLEVRNGGITAYTPVAKSATEKRRPNEAIIGDKRFNIDPVNGVVVY